MNPLILCRVIRSASRVEIVRCVHMWVQCQDAAWPDEEGGKCKSGMECFKVSQYYWQCDVKQPPTGDIFGHPEVNERENSNCLQHSTFMRELRYMIVVVISLSAHDGVCDRLCISRRGMHMC